jgi:hypothetical protein
MEWKAHTEVRDKKSEGAPTFNLAVFIPVLRSKTFSSPSGPPQIAISDPSLGTAIRDMRSIASPIGRLRIGIAFDKIGYS